MKLINHVLDIRCLIQQAFDNRFSRMGLRKEAALPVEQIPAEHQEKRRKLDELMSSHLSELGDYEEARQAAINECVFTLFNRIAAIKVMESKELFPEIITRRKENAGRSFEHNVWLENHPEERNAEREGLKHFLSDQFESLGEHIPLYRKDYPYALLPTADELNEIIEQFNAIEADADCGADVWKGDDILGWLYENFNAVEKEALKQSGEKTEYNKVSLQSQVYTPQWVVKFLVDNTLGKAYMEMFPDSRIKEKYLIANVLGGRASEPDNNMTGSLYTSGLEARPPKDLRQMRLLDPACGSGNFLIYAFSLFYDLYVDQMENYERDYSRRDIPKMIVENNLFGVDLDERAAQISQIALFIKARELGGHRSHWPAYTNVVSTHFFLDDYEKEKNAFETIDNLDESKRNIMRMIWGDLSNAYKFGSLVRVDETLDKILPNDANHNLFAQEQMEDMFSFKQQFMNQLRQKVNELGEHGSNAYTLAKTNDAISFLEIIANEYDVVVANPPYTDSGDFGTELKAFIEENYKKPLKFNSNLYACFIKRCCELAGDDGKVGMVNPPTFMYIKTFEDLRKYMLTETHISLFVEWGYLGMFSSFARVDSAMFILDKDNRKGESTFIKLNDLYEMKRKDVLFKAYEDLCNGQPNDRVYTLPQSKLKGIKSYPFIYWISDEFREKFGSEDLDNTIYIRQGGATGNNERTLRYFWEVDKNKISEDPNIKKEYVFYPKGGPFRKWYGNNWVVLAYHNPMMYDYLKSHGNRLPSESFYLQEGVTYCSSGSRGCSFRYMPSNQVISGAGPGIYPSDKFDDIYYYLGFLNSTLSTYLLECLNPTVNVTQGDIKRVPFAVPSKTQQTTIHYLSKQNSNLREKLCQYSIIEPHYESTPLSAELDINISLISFYNKENAILTQILLNESIINKTVFEVYELSEHDKQMVLDKEGIPVGDLPVSHEAKIAYKQWLLGARASEPASIDKSMTVGLGGPTSYLQFMERDKHIHITHRILPHWHQKGKVQFVTFRLADSLPQSKLEELSAYKEEWMKKHPQPWDAQTNEDYNREIRNKIDKWLDQNHGSCILQNEDVRKIVIDALYFYHEKEYILWHFVVMPNHVHLLLSPIGDNDVVKSIGSVKRFTANAINKLLGKKGIVWQSSVFDRLVRDEHNFEQYISYIDNNPRNLPAISFTLGVRASEPANSGKQTYSEDIENIGLGSGVGLGGPTSYEPLPEVLEHLENLEERDDLPKITDFDTLYQNNNEWEEFCIKRNVNPVEAWWQFKNANVLPPQRTQVLAFELITDVIRTVLAKDDDGIIPLGDRLGEERLAIRIEKEMMERGYSAAQFSQVCQLLGCPLEKYLQERFFQQLSDHLNLFMYLPKTPFIWHLSSGSHHAIELYISIYKWSRDALYRVRSIYAANREAALRDRLNAIDTSNTEGRMEAQELRSTLTELQEFCQKVDDLLASSYDPKLDDGVGKNIAPLQKRKMLSYEVLNAGQLKKYLNADW